MRRAVLFVFAVVGCGNPLPTQPVIPPAKDTSPPTKYTARELFESVKLGKDLTGQRVEVTGFVRAAEVDRKQLPKLTFEGGIGGNDRIDCFFDGPVKEAVSREDTATVTATVKGKVDGVLTLTDAKLVSVKRPKKEK